MRKNNANALLVAVLGVAALTGCGSSGDPNLHTYNTYLSTSPSTWNVHNWQTNDESYVNSFTEMGFYDVVLNSEKNGYEFVCEMASEMPIQVDPSTLSDEEYDTYFVDSGNPSEGMIWDIPLNEAACWEDGTPITASDYVESMERLLSPHYANFRADSYYHGNLVLVNAESYYKNGRETIEPAYDYLNKETGELTVNDTNIWYLSIGEESPFAESIFTNSEGQTLTFYTLLNQRSTDSTAAVELAARRITYGAAYYLTNYVDHSNDSDKTDWDEAKVKGPDAVTSTMFENLGSRGQIDIDLFDDETNVVWTCKTDSSDWSEDNREVYTKADLVADLSTFCTAMRSSASTSWSWKLPLFTRIQNDTVQMDFSEVGIRATDDYTLRLYLKKSISSLNLKFALSSNWLVNVDLYDELTIKTGTTWNTTYASNSAANYMSYGPYKLESFTAGDQINIVRNDKWYGYSDGKHEGQFQMDAINTRIIKEHNTALNEFLAGRLDDIDLTRNDMSTYGNSGRRTTTYESYTQKISFNTDRSKLLSRQSGTENKTILSNLNFRKGLSLAINRDDFASSATAGSKGFTELLNDLYLADVATGTSYRSTDQGKSVYNAVYGHLGGDTIDETNGPALAESAVGYNQALAQQYLAEGLKEELTSTEDGHLEAGNTITIEFRVYDNSSENTQNAYTFLNTAWNTALEGAKQLLVADNVISSTDQIGFSINMVKDEDYYTTAQNGNYDMIFSIWGGAAIDPYGLMQVYLDSTFTSTCEYGFKGHQDEVTLDIDLDGDGEIATDGSETKTFNAWYSYMTETLNEAQYGEDLQEGDDNYDAWLNVHTQRLRVLAGTEAGVLNRFEAIPLVARGTSSLLGLKVENGTDTYVSMVGYGGVRFMTFNYTDGEWSSFCSEYNNDLSEVYATYEKQ
jgi:oligopeptide transport system substrate-binding protein